MREIKTYTSSASGSGEVLSLCVMPLALKSRAKRFEVSSEGSPVECNVNCPVLDLARICDSRSDASAIGSITIGLDPLASWKPTLALVSSGLCCSAWTDNNLSLDKWPCNGGLVAVGNVMSSTFGVIDGWKVRIGEYGEEAPGWADDSSTTCGLVVSGPASPLLLSRA